MSAFRHFCPSQQLGPQCAAAVLQTAPQSCSPLLDVKQREPTPQQRSPHNGAVRRPGGHPTALSTSSKQLHVHSLVDMSQLPPLSSHCLLQASPVQRATSEYDAALVRSLQAPAQPAMSATETSVVIGRTSARIRMLRVRRARPAGPGNR
jgi:hypothetical protein